jgi:hypothetical protein
VGGGTNRGPQSPFDHGAGPPGPVPGSVVVRALDSSYGVGPAEGREVAFGRNRRKVQVCVGEDDDGVSRIHGVLRHSGRRWWVHATGRSGVRIGERRRLRIADGPEPLPVGRTYLVVDGADDRIHVLEVLVVGVSGPRRVGHDDPTRPRTAVELTRVERLLVVALGEQYLSDEPHPRLRSWREVAELLTDCDPERPTGIRQVEETAAGLRLRLAARGYSGLVASEIDARGDLLKHNLVTLLIDEGTIGRADLQLIEPPA